MIKQTTVFVLRILLCFLVQVAFAWGYDGTISKTLSVSRTNRAYFVGEGEKAVYLAGAHTWANFQDLGASCPPPRFDYPAYLDFLQKNNHNFIRLWVWEQARWWTTRPEEEFCIAPLVYLRTGPGIALDGGLKFDLSKLDQSYFDRLRSRVFAAQHRGIYVSVMLFNGFSLTTKGHAGKNPWQGHPFNVSNNINGINGDPDGDRSGDELHTLTNPQIIKLQEAYVRKVIETLNDLDNVIWEISNESNGQSQNWQYHLINYVKQYESGKRKQHPVGMTVEMPNGSNNELFASPADWISPNGQDGYMDNPPKADGRKVIVSDTDHLWGIGGHYSWAWKSFLRGMNPIFMDPYDGAVLGDPHDLNWEPIRRNLGYTRMYAERMDLAAMTPRNDLASTGYCLAKAVRHGAEFLVYLPYGGAVSVDLSVTSEELEVEWFDPVTGNKLSPGSIRGGTRRSLISPFGRSLKKRDGVRGLACAIIANIERYVSLGSLVDRCFEGDAVLYLSTQKEH